MQPPHTARFLQSQIIPSSSGGGAERRGPSSRWSPLTRPALFQRCVQEQSGLGHSELAMCDVNDFPTD